MCHTIRNIIRKLVLLYLFLSGMQRRRGSKAEPVSEDDILRAIGKLSALGSGFGVTKVGSQRLVKSVPGELNMDKSTVLELAAGTGYVSEAQIQQVLALSLTFTS